MKAIITAQDGTVTEASIDPSEDRDAQFAALAAKHPGAQLLIADGEAQ